jgi:putative phage-type endonuclease
MDNIKFLDFRNKIDNFNNLLEECENKKKEVIEIKKVLMYEKVLHLKSLYQPEQRTPAWYEIRKTMFTASSDVNDILGGSDRVVLKKCGISPKFMGNKYTRHGQKYEEIAQQIYESRYNKKVLEFGLVQHPSITCLGASPDGISTDGIMLEIKCPSGRKIDGKIKKGYWIQMQTQMEVCDLDICDFFECNIEEYYSFGEYKKDIYEKEYVEYLDIMPKNFDLDFIKISEDRRTDCGLEKGLIGSYRDGEDEIYVHPPFNLTTEEQYEFMKNKKKELEKKDLLLKIDFWKLVLSSMNRVPRNKKWWADNDITNKLYETWAKVEDARINGVEKYTPKKKKKIIKPTKNIKVMDLTNLFGVVSVKLKEKCMFLESDIEISSSDEEIEVIDSDFEEIKEFPSVRQNKCMFLESDVED